MSARMEARQSFDDLWRELRPDAHDGIFQRLHSDSSAEIASGNVATVSALAVGKEKHRAMLIRAKPKLEHNLRGVGAVALAFSNLVRATALLCPHCIGVVATATGNASGFALSPGLLGGHFHADGSFHAEEHHGEARRASSFFQMVMSDVSQPTQATRPLTHTWSQSPSPVVRISASEALTHLLPLPQHSVSISDHLAGFLRLSA